MTSRNEKETVGDKLSYLFSGVKTIKKTPKKQEETSEEIFNVISDEISSINDFDFNRGLGLSAFQYQLLSFADMFSLDFINTMEDFHILQTLLKSMSDYLLIKQTEIRELPIGQIQDFKISFRLIQETIRKMYQDSDFIKKVACDNGDCVSSTKIEKKLQSEFKYLYESLFTVYEAVVLSFKLPNYREIPVEMQFIDEFPMNFNTTELVNSRIKFKQVITNIDVMSDYILENRKDIDTYPAMQLHDFQLTLEGIKDEIDFMILSKVFTKAQNKKLNRSNGGVEQAYSSVISSLGFSLDAPIEKVVDLVTTFGYRVSSEILSRNVVKCGIFLFDIRNMSTYMLTHKDKLEELGKDTVKGMIEGLEELEVKILKNLKTKELSPKITYNLNRILEKDIRIAKELAGANFI